MLTDLRLKFVFESQVNGIAIGINDRHNQLAKITNNQDSTVDVTVKFILPNCITFTVSNIPPGYNSVELQSCSLGGLELGKDILNKICHYTPSDTGTEIVSTRWWTDGKAKIDFYAQDWVQYHLLHGNKIVL